MGTQDRTKDDVAAPAADGGFRFGGAGVILRPGLVR